MTDSTVEPLRDFRAAAVALAKKGFRVFPLIADGNTPTAKRFFDRATTNPKLVEKTWTQAVTEDPAHHNIGIETGRDVLVLDFDIKKNKQGLQDFAYLDLQGLDSSFMSSTPSGGFHVFLRLPEGVTVDTRLGTLRVDNYVCEGTDVKGWHGYVVAPGSETARGRYEWKSEPKSLDDIPYAPDWLIEAIGKPRERKADADEPPPLGWDRPQDEERAVTYLYEAAPEAIQGNFGDKTTYDLVHDLRDLGMSRTKALDLLLTHWNEQKASPPWMPDDLRQKVDNAYHYAKFRAGRLQCCGFEAYETPAEAAPVIAPAAIAPTANDNVAAASKATPPKFGKLTLESFAQATKAAFGSRTNWLVKNLLDIGAVSVAYAEPNAGKSFLALELAHCVATGRNFAGLPVRRGAALYVSLEGTGGFRWRMAALQRHRPAENVPIHLASGSLNLFARKHAVFELVAAAKAVAAEFGLPIHLIIIDTLARTMAPGDESATKDMSVIVERAGEIAVGSGAHVMLIHHSGKDATKGARGSMALRAGIDTELEIKASADREHGKPAQGRIIIRKQREYDYLPPINFRLRKVDAGVTADLETKVSCIVDFPIVREAPEEELSPALRVALDALRSITPGGQSATAKAWDAAIAEATEHRGQERPKPDACGKYRSRLKEKGLVMFDASRKYRPSSPNLPTFEDVGT